MIFYTAAYGNGHWIVAGDGGRMLRLGPVIHLRSLEKRPDGEVRFAVSGPVGSSYRLQTSPDLQEWNNLMTILATNETMHASDRSTSILQQRYYRIVSP